jgi:glycosyltransferase involved in cell wall biosynthesis
MVLVEAQAYGVVPIAFDSFSSLSSIIQDGYSGIVVKPFDLENYIEKLIDLMGNQSKIIKIGLQGQESVKKFLPTSVVQEWLSLFNSLN